MHQQLPGTEAPGPTPQLGYGTSSAPKMLDFHWGRKTIGGSMVGQEEKLQHMLASRLALQCFLHEDPVYVIRKRARNKNEYILSSVSEMEFFDLSEDFSFPYVYVFRHI